MPTDPCIACDGDGYLLPLCRTCNGYRTTATGEDCPPCNGNGYIRQACPACQPRWVAVTERLPEPGVWVLVWHGVYYGHAVAYQDRRGWNYAHAAYPCIAPTHWRDLPPPPEVPHE